jgi:hypothetical protein
MGRVSTAAKQGGRTGAGHPGSRQPIGDGLLLLPHCQLPHCNPLTMANPSAAFLSLSSRPNSRRLHNSNPTHT